MNKFISILLCIILLNAPCVYATENHSSPYTISGNTWVSLYYNFIVSNPKYFDTNGMVFDFLSLLDLDLDGTPELIGGTVSKMRCPMTIGLTIKNGKVVELIDKTNGLCGVFEQDEEERETVGVEAYLYGNLYLDKTTNSFKWIGGDSINNGITPYVHNLYELKLDGNILTSKTISSPLNTSNLQLIQSASLLSPSTMETDAILGFFNGYVPDFALAHSSSQKFNINGKIITVPTYTINGTHYVKLRDIAFLVKDTPFSFNIVSLNSNTILLKKGNQYTPSSSKLIPNKNPSTYASVSQQNIFSNESVQVPLGLGMYLINGSNYIAPQDFPYSLGFYIQDNKFIFLEN